MSQDKTIFVIIITFFCRCAKHGRDSKKNENSAADVRVSFETFQQMRHFEKLRTIARHWYNPILNAVR
jgi:hypothetical protein